MSDPDKPGGRAKTGPRKGIDWFAIRKAYESGNAGLIMIAKEFGVDQSSISRKANSEGWVRGGIKRKLVLLTESELVRRVGDLVVTEEAVEEAAKTTADVIRTHRTVAHVGRALVTRIMSQLLSDIDDRETIEGEIVGSEQNPLRRAQMLAAIALPSHVMALQRVSVAAANFIKIEREAFGLDAMGAGSEGGSEEPYDPTKEGAVDAYRRLVG